MALVIRDAEHNNPRVLRNSKEFQEFKEEFSKKVGWRVNEVEFNQTPKSYPCLMLVSSDVVPVDDNGSGAYCSVNSMCFYDFEEI